MTHQSSRIRNVVSDGTVAECLVQAGTVGNVHFSPHPALHSRGIPKQLPAGVPAALWTDRAHEMDELTALAQRPGPVEVVLVGEPEVGTSALAVQWIHDHADRYGDGQLFANLGAHHDPTTAGEVLSWWLPALGIEVPHAVAARSAVWRSATVSGRFALLLDHALDEDQVTPLLVSSPTSVTLVTSRTPLLGLARYGAFHLQLDPLDAADAVSLLDRLAGPRSRQRLVHACQGRPGRIRRLAAVLTLQPAKPSTPIPFDQEVSTDMVYHLSSHAAQQLFRRIGDHVRDFDATTAEAMTGTDQPSTAAMLDELVNAAVLTPRPAPVSGLQTRYVMAEQAHRCAAFHAADDPAGVREAARKRVTNTLLARLLRAAFVLDRDSLRYNPAFAPYQDATVSPYTDRHAALAWTTAELPAVLALMRAAGHAGEDDTVAYLAESIWAASLIAGFHDHFFRIHELAVTAIRQSHPMRSILLTRLSWAHRKQGRWHEVIDTAESARSAAAADAGDLKAESTAISALGRVHHQRGHYPQARTLYRQSRILAAKAGDERGIGLRTRHIADCWAKKQQYLPAKELYEEALEYAHPQQDWLNWALTAAKLATVLTALGTPQQAVEHLERAEHIIADSGSARYHADVLAAKAANSHALGLLTAAQENCSRAEELYHKAGELDEAETMRTRRESLTGGS